jgi:UDP-N-acetylglucosamine:LPS N-acetylglucosamine transferase
VRGRIGQTWRIMTHAGRPHIMVVLGQGGHTTELLHLVDLLGSGNCYCYMLFEEDQHSAAHIRHPGPLHRVPRPRYRPGKRLHPIWDPLLALRSLWAVFRVVRRERPNALLMTGPSIAILAALCGKLIGARVIFVETGSRVTSLSNTGRVMRYVAHDFFVQSERLAQQMPGTRFAGRLW